MAVVTIFLFAAVFEADVGEVPEARVQKMRGTTWHVGCPVPPEALRLVRLRHHGFDGEVHEGELIVHRAVAAATVEVFRELFERGYPIQRMVPASEYGGDDDRSMAANNTSAFNCRPVTGRGRGFSAHSYGRAVDLNPLYNPYVKGARVLPPAGKRWADRTRPHPSRIDADGPVVRAFESRGFRWGGRWTRLKDYQHFERPLR